MKGWMYILECADGSYYTGSTNDLNKRLWEHNNFLGANYTRKKHPVKLVYSEEYNRIDDAFYREKQVQGWSHAKKKALIEQRTDMLHGLAECRNDSHCCNNPDASAPLNNPVASAPLNNPVASAPLNNPVASAPLSDRVASAPLSDRVGKDMPNKNRSSSGAETTDAKEKL